MVFLCFAQFAIRSPQSVIRVFIRRTILRAKQLALLAKDACEDKKGEDILVLDVKKLSTVVDYFVICSGSSSRHVKAIAENVVDFLDEKKVDCNHKEGLLESNWVLLDYGDVMIHVFHPETRQFYNLERLWGEAKPLIGEVN